MYIRMIHRANLDPLLAACIVSWKRVESEPELDRPLMHHFCKEFHTLPTHNQSRIRQNLPPKNEVIENAKKGGFL